MRFTHLSSIFTFALILCMVTANTLQTIQKAERSGRQRREILKTDNGVSEICMLVDWLLAILSVNIISQSLDPLYIKQVGPIPIIVGMSLTLTNISVAGIASIKRYKNIEIVAKETILFIHVPLILRNFKFVSKYDGGSILVLGDVAVEIPVLVVYLSLWLDLQDLRIQIQSLSLSTEDQRIKTDVTGTAAIVITPEFLSGLLNGPDITGGVAKGINPQLDLITDGIRTVLANGTLSNMIYNLGN